MDIAEAILNLSRSVFLASIIIWSGLLLNGAPGAAVDITLAVVIWLVLFVSALRGFWAVEERDMKDNRRLNNGDH